mgnify:CR=1 FL=1
MDDKFGFYRGAHADGVLILGESHHGDKEDSEKSPEECEAKERNCKTENVVNNYLALYRAGGYDRCYEFFEKIVSAFHFQVENRAAFWNSVYFKNYVCDHLCGVGDDKATTLINRNRTEYNDVLFDFLNKQNITTVFVFGRLVYDSLPRFAAKGEKCGNCDDGTLKAGRQRDYISHCKYLGEIPHSATNIILTHDVEFFGLRHPSAQCGFSAENYCSVLGEFVK